MPGASGYGPIFDRAQDLLTGVVAGYGHAEINPTIANPPPSGPVTPPQLQWVNEGYDFSTAVRDECIATGLASGRTGFPGMPEGRAITAASGLVIDLACWVFRLSPLPEDDSQVQASEYTNSAKVIYADLWIVLRSMMLGVEPNASLPGVTPLFGPTVKASMPEIRSLGPQGGLVGFEVALNVEAS